MATEARLARRGEDLRRLGALADEAGGHLAVLNNAWMVGVAIPSVGRAAVLGPPARDDVRTILEGPCPKLGDRSGGRHAVTLVRELGSEALNPTRPSPPD